MDFDQFKEDCGFNDYVSDLRDVFDDFDSPDWFDLEGWLGGIVLSVILVLLLIFGGEYLCSLFFGSWQHLIDFNSSFLILSLCFVLVLFLLPVISIYFFFVCLPAFLAFLTYPWFENWIVTAIATVIAGLVTGPFAQISFSFANKTVHFFWQFLGYFFVRKAFDIESARKKFAMWALLTVLLFLPVTLFAFNWCIDDKDPLDVLSEISARDKVQVDIYRGSGLNKMDEDAGKAIGNAIEEKIKEKTKEKIKEEVEEKVRQIIIIDSIMN